MTIWNCLMAIGVLGALAQAYGAISTKINDPLQGPFVIGGVAVFLLLALVVSVVEKAWIAISRTRERAATAVPERVRVNAATGKLEVTP